MNKTEFWKRLIAEIIDAVIFGGLWFLHPQLIVLGIIYETILVSQWDGYTVGKKIMGIRVVSTSGKRVDWVKAFVRSVAKILSSICLGLGFFWMLWDSRSQTWHDKIADTFVVKD